MPYKTTEKQHKKCPRCKGEVWMVQYDYDNPQHYDGISEFACKDEKCGWRVGRWSGIELKE